MQSNVEQPRSLPPYLSLPYILSLTWLAYPILSILFIVFRLQISSSSAQVAVSHAKASLLTSCKAAEQAATSAASLPRFMAIATNSQIADAVNSSLNGAREALILVLTVLEAIVNFVIDIYRSTLLCFLELVIRGALAILIGAVQEISNAIQSTLSALRTSIQNDISSANSLINSTVDGINKILPFGKTITPPQISIPSLDALQNFTLPTDFETALTNLNNSIPSLDSLRQSIESVVDTPFELLKADINNTFATISFNQSTLPVPQLNTLTFCDTLDTSVVDNLGHDLTKVAKIGTVILIVLALLLLAASCAVEIVKWRSLRQNMSRVRQNWQYSSVSTSLNPDDRQMLHLHSMMLHPLLTRLVNFLTKIFHLSPSQSTNLQFFGSYIFHAPALACFLIGFLGLLSVELQLIAIGPLERKYTAQVSSTISDFTNTIATNVNASMYNQSSSYADGINSQIITIQTTINNGLFGWVDNTTTTLNNTLVSFYNDVQNAVNTVFGGTILDAPAQDFVKCFIGSKVDAFENALTFLHDNLHINMPTVNETLLVLSPADVDSVSRPISEAAVGGGPNQGDSGIVQELLDDYISSLRMERIMFLVFIGLWIIVVLVALLIILWHSYGRDWFRALRSKRSGIDDNGDIGRSFLSGSLGSKEEFVEQKIALPATELAAVKDAKAPRKLRAFGRKGMGREILVPDGDQMTETSVSSRQPSLRGSKPWWSRKARGTQMSDAPNTIAESTEDYASRRTPALEPLRIPSERDPSPDQPAPRSAWSVSPNFEIPRALPWVMPPPSPSRQAPHSPSPHLSTTSAGLAGHWLQTRPFAPMRQSHQSNARGEAYVNPFITPFDDQNHDNAVSSSHQASPFAF
ncbi:hypothetical protein SISSUDRAFT_1000423 [Sistotremastrum suecicum HHB10207 ss-3]|uniref:Plasma membrane fusion protein PRM1 n=1 Tax=Sistotremastrum suecicum HHB10207 ss-3 TaxID=1314776 RepID=A0A166GCG0_9AGAM|nr:hypothetical protein SISSUDRAFT_1000423 [Sistotremastrum suecicum HHB10207 ss-3]